MGWGNGCYVAEELACSIKKHVKDRKLRKTLYAEVVRILESHDWDTRLDALGVDKDWDAILKGEEPTESEFPVVRAVKKAIEE